MARTTFSGPVRSMGGIYQQGPGSVVAITADTTLNPVSHGGRILSVGGTLAADVTITLPTIVAASDGVSSGPGRDYNTTSNIGVLYTIWVPTTIATSSLKIGTDGTDKYVGSLLSVDTDTSGAMVGFTAAAANDFINLNGGTTGGVAGTWIEIRALAALKYMVTGVVLGTGVVATPFANA
jgi:hypothetical protein